MSEKLVKVKSTLPHRAGMTITLPEGLGQVTFDENCETEVTEELASKIEEMNLAGFEVVKKKSDLDDDQDEDVQLTSESLSALKVGDLQEMCKQNQFPEEEWKGKKKAELVEYILEKVAALTDNQEDLDDDQDEDDENQDQTGDQTSDDDNKQ